MTTMLLCLLVACGGEALSGPPIANVPSPPRVQESSVPFDCSNANVALGHPDAAIQACAEMQHLPGVFSVMLKGPQGYVSRIVITDEHREIERDHGPAFAGRLLDRHRVDRATDLTLNEIVFALDAAGGLPPGFDPAVASVDVPEIDRSRLELAPLRLVLLREIVPSSTGPGGIPAPRYERATLTRDADGWTWTVEGWAEGRWTAAASWPLR